MPHTNVSFQAFSIFQRLNAICSLRIANYTFSGQYWCAACSFVSQGAPECSPSLDSPGTTYLNVQVQGPPTQSDALPSVQKVLSLSFLPL